MQYITYARFAHELAHTLTLEHGGFEAENFKPNYPSLMNYSYSWDINDSPETLQGTAIQFSPGTWPNIDEINGVPEVNWAPSGTTPSFLTSCDDNEFTISSRNVDWNKNSAYSGSASQVVRVPTGCFPPCAPITIKKLLKDNNDAAFMDANLASMVPGAGDGPEQPGASVDLSKAAAISPNDKEGRARAIREALERRDAERGVVDEEAERKRRMEAKDRAFKARNGVGLAERGCEN